MWVLRLFSSLVLLIVSPLLILFSAAAILATDIYSRLTKRFNPAPNASVRNNAVSVVIPNWNGRDLLEKYIPSVIAATRAKPEHEVIVVDNASSDGSAEFLAKSFPEVRVVSLPQNLGFGGGSNAGFQAAQNDIVVLLNSDMRVEPNFLEPLLRPFSDARVFSVSCQIFFSDPTKRREETGLTQGWWESGGIRVRHRIDDVVRDSFPCYYSGGGSSAYDRRKFLELGGFDPLYHPFYFEDTDLGHMAWKRGWKVLYQPQSIVFHEHRGTIGRKFSDRYIQNVLKKNAVLYCWKNIHDWRLLPGHFAALFLDSFRAMLLGTRPWEYTFQGLAQAMMQLPQACRARLRSRRLAVISDRLAFQRQRAGHFRDHFDLPEELPAERLQILFASPYPIAPPVHGGAVFMEQTLEALSPAVDLHLVNFLDRAEQRPAQDSLQTLCKTTYFQVRQPPRRQPLSSLVPQVISEFADEDFAWAIHRTIYQERIDLLQLEYTMLGQYASAYRHIPCMLFEHDVFFQSLGRSLSTTATFSKKTQQLFEYLRIMRYELALLRRMTRVQVCSDENARFLESFDPALKPKLDDALRAGIRVARYKPVYPSTREPNTLLFIGSFQHLPNFQALQWFAKSVLPRIVLQNPSAKLMVVGSDPPPSLSFLNNHPNIALTGSVPDIREPLSRYKVFVCPILTGSGVRVKLLEAFASGIPTVSTFIGAEGLANQSGEICLLADSAREFADACVQLLTDEAAATRLAVNARHFVEQEKDSALITQRLLNVYRREVSAMRHVALHEPVERTHER